MTSVCVDPKGSFLYTGSADRQCRQWDLATKECTLVLAAHSDAVTGVSCTEEEGLITSSSDTTAKRWHLHGPHKGSVNMTYAGHSDSVNAVCAGGGKVPNPNPHPHPNPNPHLNPNWEAAKFTRPLRIERSLPQKPKRPLASPARVTVTFLNRTMPS